MSLREGRGRWTMLGLDTESAATFIRGAAVGLSTIGRVKEYTSTQSQILGIAMHASADSLPAGKVVVKVPCDADNSFWITTLTNVAASSLSAGQGVGCVKSGNDHVAVFGGSLVSQIGISTGRYRLSPVSEVECIPNGINWAFGSTSAVTVLS